MGFCFERFGKKYRELTPEEKTEYNRLRKRVSRENNPEKDRIYYLHNKEKYVLATKKWKEKHPERHKELVKKCSMLRWERVYKERGYGAFEGSKIFRTYGKRFKDMTIEEKRQVKRDYAKEYRVKAKEIGDAKY